MRHNFRNNRNDMYAFKLKKKTLRNILILDDHYLSLPIFINQTIKIAYQLTSSLSNKEHSRRPSFVLSHHIPNNLFCLQCNTNYLLYHHNTYSFSSKFDIDHHMVFLSWVFCPKLAHNTGSPYKIQYTILL